MFNGKGDPSGRLSMVKDISIHLSVAQTFSTSDRHSWARLFGKESLGFPMLEFLTLDFTDWNLGGNEGLIVSAASRSSCFVPLRAFFLTFLQVRPLIDRFRGPLGLKKVVVKGVTHKKSLQQLKKGLMREGGSLVVRGK